MSNMFTLLVCADLYGNKVNLEVPFAAQPTVNELTRVIEKVFEQEAAFIRPPGFPVAEVKVVRIQIYDDTYLKWMDLVNSSQLHEYDQLYVFQPQSAWHVDLQKDLPAPRPPHTGPAPGVPVSPTAVPSAAPQQLYQQPPPVVAPVAAPYQVQQPPAFQPAHQTFNSAPPVAMAPMQAMAPYNGGQPVGSAQAAGERANVPKDQKVQAVFRELDTQQKGYVELGELERGFRARGIDFSSATCQELFSKGDANRDNRLDWNEWNTWADLYPNTLEVMYYRGRDTVDEEQMKHDRQLIQDQLDRNRQRDADLRRQIEECAREAQMIQQQFGEVENRTREAGNRRHLLEQQERDLLEQEIKLERQKDQLRASQHRFQEVAQTFDSSAAVQGSPRRYVFCSQF